MIGASSSVEAEVLGDGARVALDVALRSAARTCGCRSSRRCSAGRRGRDARGRRPGTPVRTSSPPTAAQDRDRPGTASAASCSPIPCGPAIQRRPVAATSAAADATGTLGVEQGDGVAGQQRARVGHGAEQVVPGEQEQQLPFGSPSGLRQRRARARSARRTSRLAPVAASMSAGRSIGCEVEQGQTTIDPSTPMTWPVT